MFSAEVIPLKSEITFLSLTSTRIHPHIGNMIGARKKMIASAITTLKIENPVCLRAMAISPAKSSVTKLPQALSQSFAHRVGVAFALNGRDAVEIGIHILDRGPHGGVRGLNY